MFLGIFAWLTTAFPNSSARKAKREAHSTVIQQSRI